VEQKARRGACWGVVGGWRRRRRSGPGRAGPGRADHDHEFGSDTPKERHDTLTKS